MTGTRFRGCAMPRKDPEALREYRREYYERTRAESIAKTAAWQAANPERTRANKLRHQRRVGNRARMLKARYGITEAEYNEMLAAQGDVCAICKGAQPSVLPVDHDHVTGRIRGILCSPCNRLLGDAKDNIEVLQAAIAYLQQGAPTGAKEA